MSAKTEPEEHKVLPSAKREPLLTSIRVKNFLCFKELEVTSLDQRNIPFQGGEGDGKSAFIVALLVGLGYDILLENDDMTTLCGIQLSHIVHRGESECRLETTITLQSAPSPLKSVFGPYLTIIRNITRNHPLKLSPIELAPSDARGVTYDPIKKVTRAELRMTLELVGISPKWFRLLLLDEGNLSYLVHHPSEWYELYEHAFLETKRKLLKEFLIMNIHIEKLEGDVSWRQVAEMHLDLESEKEYVDDSLVLMHDREKSERALSQLRTSMNTLNQEIKVSRGINLKYQTQLEELPIDNFFYNMSLVFRSFLSAQNLTGNLLVDSDRRQIGIWINPPHPGSKEPRPSNLDEALVLWEKTTTVRKRIAVMGLYFALWRINESCPVFFVDSFSATETEFKLPDRVMPIFMELTQEKAKASRTFHQQFVYTIQGSSHVPIVQKDPPPSQEPFDGSLPMQ